MALNRVVNSLCCLDRDTEPRVDEEETSEAFEYVPCRCFTRCKLLVMFPVPSLPSIVFAPLACYVLSKDSDLLRKEARVVFSFRRTYLSMVEASRLERERFPL